MCMCFEMCGCVNVSVLSCVVVCMFWFRNVCVCASGFCYLWLCVRLGVLVCECFYV